MDKNASCSMKTGCDDGSCDTVKKNCCWGTLLKGAALGGIALFAIYSISWMFLPWHMSSIHAFSNEAAVAKAVDAGAGMNGVYMLPSMSAGKEPAITKPYAFVSVLKEGMDPKGFNAAMMKEALLCFVLAGLLTCLLKKLPAGCCGLRASFKIGLLVALAHYVPNMIFMGFPLDYSMIGMVDDVVAITVAGYLIRRFVTKSGECA